MSVMTSVIPHGRPFTVDDLEAMPDDGNRYELIDERIGAPYYWILDPAGDGALTAFANEGGGYAQVARVTGDESFVAREPFEVTIVPARLLDGLRPR
jgi:hypothetical protein